MRIEYLVVSSENSTFCNSAEGLVNLISLDARIESNKEKKTFLFSDSERKSGSKTITLNYSVESGTVEGHNHRYFHVILEKEKLGQEEIEICISFTEVIKDLCQRLPGGITVNTLWNDVFKDYSVEGYKLIFSVENLLRRFISRLLIINMGANWIDEVIPDEVVDRNKERLDSNIDFMHNTYLSDLEKIIFSGQREKGLRTIAEVQLLVERKISEKAKTIDIKDIDGVVSKSIWDKYFVEKYTQLKPGKLRKNLTELNKLRSDVAHNRFIDKLSFDKIKRISKEMEGDLKLAFSKLPKIKIEKEDFIRKNDVMKFYSALEEQIISLLQKKSDFNLIQPNDHLIDIIASDKQGNKIGIEVKNKIDQNGHPLSIGKQILMAIWQHELNKVYVVHLNDDNISSQYKNTIMKYLNNNKIANVDVEFKRYFEFLKETMKK